MTPEPSDRERRVDEIIAAYLEATAAGKAPDRQELLAQHPEVAAELAAFFADHDAMRQLARPLGDAVAPVGQGAQPPGSPEATVAPVGKPAPAAENLTIAHAKPQDSAKPLDTIRYFGDYELLEEIARGGMGVVYKARQVKLNRIVAVKMILAGQLASEADVKRFYTEAEAAANLQHPNIVAIHEVGQHEGQHYFSMDFVEGKSLAAMVREHPLAPKDAARYVRIIAEAIQHAHDKGILHRDLKPSNVLIDTTDQPRVTDFGLAKRHEADAAPKQPATTRPGEAGTTRYYQSESSAKYEPEALATGSPALTEAGQIVGTAGYMPPEQARGERVGPWADVYSLGAILYELLTGRAPFRGTTMFDTLDMVVNVEPVSPRRFQAGVPRDLETICLKCLQKEPPARYSSAKSLANDLRRFEAGEPIIARPVGRLERAVKWSRRHPARATAAMLVLLSVGLLGVGAVIALLWVEAEAARDNAETAYEGEQIAKQRVEKVNEALKESLLAEKKARAEADGAKETLARFLYLDRVALAWREFGAGNALRARELLDGCDEKYKHWEWYQLDLRFQRETFSLAGHKDIVTQVCFSPDGELLASVSGRTVRLWQRPSGKLFATLAAHDGEITQVTFSPDAKILASASEDKTIKLWDTSTGKELMSLVGHKLRVKCLAFSPDGTNLASGSTDRTVKLWQVASGKELVTLTGHNNDIWHVVFSSDGKRLASGGQERTLKLWDPVSGKEVATLVGHKAPSEANAYMNSLAFSPDNHILASANDDGTVRLWDAGTGKAVRTLMGHKARVLSVAFSPDGHVVASSSGDNTVKLWDVTTGKELCDLLGHKSYVPRVRFSPDGEVIASSSNDMTAKLWDVASGKELATLTGHAGAVWDVCFSPDGKHLASASQDKTVKLWERTANKAYAKLRGHKQIVTEISFSPDGKQLVSASNDRTLRIWDTETGIELASLVGHKIPPHFVQFCPIGTRLISDSQRGGDARLWDLKSGKLIAELIPYKYGVPSLECLAFSPDGLRMASGGGMFDKTVKVWDATTGKELLKLEGHNGGVMHVAYSHDGKLLASASQDKTIRLWNPASGLPLMTLAGHKSWVCQLAFSADGERLASASSDGSVKLWDPNSGNAIFTLAFTTTAGYQGDVRYVCFSPGGERLAAGTLQGSIRLWDSETGKEIATMPGHGPNLSFSPDGLRLATGGFESNTVKLWDALMGKELATFVGSKAALSPNGQQLAFAGPENTITLCFAKVDPSTWEKRKAFWQDQQAASALQSRRWFAAAFHLRELLKQPPDDSQLQRQLQHAEAELKKEREAKSK